MHRLFGGGRFFGPGEIRLAVLSLLGESPAHGYQLMTRLERRLGDGYQASAGTIYPTLQQLEDESLVRAEVTDDKKVYSLTHAGRHELDSHADDVEDIWRRAEAKSEWGVMRHPDAAEIVGPALRLAKAALKAVVKSHGDPTVVEAVRDVLDDARERIDRIRKRRWR